MQFTVGTTTLRHRIKHADFVLMVALAITWAVAWLGFRALERYMRRVEGDDGVNGARALMAYASLPLIAWLGSLFYSTTDALDFVHLSGAAVLIAGLLLIAAARRPRAPADTAALSFEQAAGLGGLAVVLGALSALVVPFAINRLSVQTKSDLIWTGIPSPIALAWIGAGLGFIGAWWAWRRPDRTVTRFTIVLLIAQAALPWAFLLGIPLPWHSGDATMEPLPSNRAFLIALVLVAISYVDLARRAPTKGTQTPTLLSGLSPLCIAAGLVFLKLPSTTVYQLSTDDYHWGEWLIPTWMSFKYGSVPFSDYVPARGMVNYAPGLIATAAFGAPTAAAIQMSYGFFTIALCILGVLTLTPLMGLLPSALLILPLPLVNSVSEIDVVNTAGLAWLLVQFKRHRPSIWLVEWAVLGVVLFLWGPAQGATIVLGTMPLALWQFGRAFRQERVTLRKTLMVAVPVTLLALMLTPLGRVVIGAVRYGTDHSEVGLAAHGVEWAFSATVPVALHRWLFEGIRASFLAVPLTAIALLVIAFASGATDDETRARRQELLLVGVPVAIIGLLFIYRVGMRIDAGSMTRFGYTSMWLLLLLLPMVLYAAWGRGRWPAILAIAIGTGTIVSTGYGPINLAAAGWRAYTAPPNPPLGVVDGALLGMPNVGVMPMEPKHLANLRTLQRTLDVLLNPDETFLGLTERNAAYFYLGRRVPLESGALYNLPNDRQQLRSVERLRAAPVPVVLTQDGTDGLFDAGPASMRSYAVYRYLLLSHYVPVRIDGVIYLVAPDRLPRLAAHPELKVEMDNPAALLDRAFLMKNVMGLPATWGDSWGALSHAATQVRALATTSMLMPTQVQALGQDRYHAAGVSPTLTWEFSSTPIAGTEAGPMVINLACGAADHAVQMDVLWAAPGEPFDAANSLHFDGYSGTLVVPLDASPRWLLAPAIGRLQVRLAEGTTCPEFTLTAPTLWQRRVVAQMNHR